MHKRSATKGYSLIEVLVVIAIFITVGALVAVSITSIQSRKKLQAGAEQVKIDIYFIQSRAVTGLLRQRFVIEDNQTYRLEEDEDGSGSWVTVQEDKPLPEHVFFTDEDVLNRAEALEFGSNGFPNFNGEPNAPFLTLVHEELEGKFKEIHIDVSGRVDIQGN